MYNRSQYRSHNPTQPQLKSARQDHGPGHAINHPPPSPPTDAEVEITRSRPTPSSTKTSLSKTAPVHHPESVRRSSGNVPQLSERDSIFATTYEPPTSPPSHNDPSDVVDYAYAGVNRGDVIAALPKGLMGTTRLSDTRPSQLTYPRDIQPTVRARQPKKRTTAPLPRLDPSDLIKSRFIAARSPPYVMGEPSQDVTAFGLSPMDSPSSDRPTTSSSTSSVIHFVESDADREERSRYRLWRQGQGAADGKLLFTRNRSTDRTHVDKKIQATLPKMDANVAVARSRKASQYLGLFKENEAAEEQKRRSERRLHNVEEVGQEDAETTKGQGEKVQALADAGVETGQDAPPGDAGVVNPSVTLAEWSQFKHQDPFEKPEADVESQENGGPKRSATLSEAITKTVRKLGLSSNRQAEASSPLSIPRKLLDAESHQDESEESEHELISHALYFPHRQVVPDPSDSTLGQPNARRTPATEIPPVPESHTGGTKVTEKSLSSSPNEVEISLQSQNETELWHGDLPASATKHIEDDDPNYVSSRTSESESESGTESAQSDYGYESGMTDTAATPKVKQQQIAPRHRHRKDYTEPLGAVELKPFNHQVGGHSTVFRFSRRAICKQLNNRENEFYETVEKLHPELLQFMPRYIGVLNVAYRKGPKRKKTKPEVQEDQDESIPERDSKAGNRADESKDSKTRSDTHSKVEERPRIVSHSQTETSIPRVILENNRHIIPQNLFKLPSRPHTPQTHSSPSLISQMHRASYESRVRSPEDSPREEVTNMLRPLMKHNSSWGATTVNRKLQEQVLREVFAAPPIHRNHRHHRPHATAIARRRREPNVGSGSVPGTRRGSSDITAMHSSFSEGTESVHEQIIKAAMESKARAADVEQDEFSPLHAVLTEDSHGRRGHQDEETATRSRSRGDSTHKLRRRHSGGGLKRRPTTIDCASRGDLEFHEEEAYGGDGEDEVFPMDNEGSPLQTSRSTPKLQPSPLIERQGSGYFGAAALQKPQEIGTPELDQLPPADDDLPVYGPEPLNPKQAQVVNDENERVQLFLLLEDLTAGMSKPCVLDLKMGTRQYGVEADEKKQRSQRKKCQNTTSRGLGVRVCGMQVWDTKDKRFSFEDKYFGRDLKAGEPFQSALTRFFDDGYGRHSMALKLIPTILEQLRNLERIIKGLPGYRFYASSLLMIYDRGDSADDNPSSQQQNSSDPSEPPQQRGDHHQHHTNHDKPTEPTIRLKIVDFANCVTAEDPLPPTARCPPQNAGGIDRGYLRGLRSLRMYFKRIWEEVRSDEGGFVERGEGEGMAVGVGAHGEWGAGAVLLPGGLGWEDEGVGGGDVEGDLDDGEVST